MDPITMVTNSETYHIISTKEVGHRNQSRLRKTSRRESEVTEYNPTPEQQPGERKEGKKRLPSGGAVTFYSEDGWHRCHFCGESVKDGHDLAGNRHWLSDCRPDLVEHEAGETCTWSTRPHPGNCYAYQDRDTWKWGAEHKHFYSDGPM